MVRGTFNHSNLKISILTIMLLGLLGGCGIVISGGGGSVSSPGRFINAQRSIDTTLNLADALEAQEGQCASGRQAQAADLVKQARSAAQDIQTSMAMFDDTDVAYSRVNDAVKAAAKVSRLVYYFCMSCSGIPPVIPNIPLYTETFWDIAS